MQARVSENSSLALRAHLTYLALVAVILALFPAQGHAGTWVAFGPKSYTRGTGAPVTVTDTFTLLNPTTRYTLKAFNGGLQNDQTELVSNSIVILNGVQVIGPRNFNQNVSEVDVPIAPQAPNTLSVQVRGQPGGVLAVEIIGVDNDPPVATASISPPPNAAGWSNSDVTVSFTCSDTTSGVALCPAPITVRTEGANQVVSAIATDLADNTTTASVIVNVDKTPPIVAGTIDPPPDAAGWNSSSVTVTFTCSDALSGVASCSSPVAVTTEGANQVITGRAVDAAGNAVTTSVDVNISTRFFHVRNYGGKCLDYGPPWPGTGATVFLNDCASAHPIRVVEIPDRVDSQGMIFRHEVVLFAGGSVIGIHNPPQIDPGGPPPPPQTHYSLELQRYDPVLATTANQIFRLDGDSIILEGSLPCLNTDTTTPSSSCPPPPPQLVVQIQNARGADGSPLVVAPRNLADSEFWDFDAVDGSGKDPTSGFVRVATNYDLWNAICQSPRVKKLSNGSAIDDPGQPDDGASLSSGPFAQGCSFFNVGWGSVIEVTDSDPTECGPTYAPNVGPCIDLSDYPALVLPAGVTLRGNRRGTAFGPQLFQSNPEDRANPPGSLCSRCMVVVEGDYVRITGLRMRGESRSTTSGPYRTAVQVDFPHPFAGPPPFSIATMTEYIATIDHNDISDWGEAAVAVTTSYSFDPDTQMCTTKGVTFNGKDFEQPCGCTLVDPSTVNTMTGDPSTGMSVSIDEDPSTLANVRVVRNFLHHNERDSGGYGVSVGRASIEGNTFLMNRHAITAGGEPHNEYRAAYNLVLSRAPSYSGSFGDYFNQDFDMHGTEDNHHWYGGQGGFYVNILGNTFLATNRVNYELRGTPCFDTDFHHNVSLEQEDDALLFKNSRYQILDSVDHINIGPTPNQFELANPTDHLGVGDFDGDGADDLLLATGHAWYYSPRGAREWRFLSAKPDAIDLLLLGDFDGDRRADVVGMHGGELVVSWGGISDWQVLNPTVPAGASMTDMAVGDFDGDGIADIFYADGATWWVSFGGNTPFVLVQTSVHRVRDLRFGDFDGNGTTDIFSVVSDGSSNYWMVSYSPKSAPGTLFASWDKLQPALTDTVDGLVVADFSGIEHASVASMCGFLDSCAWRISYRGFEPWTKVSQPNWVAVPGLSFAAVGRFLGHVEADALLWNGVAIPLLGAIDTCDSSTGVLTHLCMSVGAIHAATRYSAQDMR